MKSFSRSILPAALLCAALPSLASELVSGETATAMITNTLAEGVHRGYTQAGECEVSVIPGCGSMEVIVKDALTPAGRSLMFKQDAEISGDIKAEKSGASLSVEVQSSDGEHASLSIIRGNDSSQETLVHVRTSSGESSCFVR